MAGWNIKPETLLFLLENSVREATWIDSDMLFLNSLPRTILCADEQKIIVAEEPRVANRQGTIFRTKQWGLEPGKLIKRTANTCILRVTHNHIDLLRDYRDLMRSSDYVEAMNKPFLLRPRHLAGDQDVLTALLGAKKYQNLKIAWVKNGIEIAHCFDSDGFGVFDRLNCFLKGAPAIIHSQGQKPWRQFTHRPLHLELSPYTYFAKQYAYSLSPEETGWMSLSRPAARILDAVTLSNPYLSGIPPVLARKAKRFNNKVKRGLKRIK
jgi:lipopolysaccharide biosynthesis glycosyltransferase